MDEKEVFLYVLLHIELIQQNKTFTNYYKIWHIKYQFPKYFEILKNIFFKK